MLTTSIVFTTASTQALGHTTEQGFVLLLPTNVYIASGVATVIMTLIALIVLPANFTEKLFTPKRLTIPEFPKALLQLLKKSTGWLSLATLATLVLIGFTATHDPLRNLLPLMIWTVFWMGIVFLHGVLGDLWSWINPWRPLSCTATPRLVLPEILGSWPAVGIFLLFISFSLADTAPEDPQRLTLFVFGYWVFTATGVWLFGFSSWTTRVECFSMLLQRFARLASLSITAKHLKAGFPGWRWLDPPAAAAETTTMKTASAAIFTLTLLAAGSFDGLNETFWWLARIDINPLEFQGRSAVIVETTLGLLVTVAALVCSYFACVLAGQKLANNQGERQVSVKTAFIELSVSLLPIALAYHFAHFLTAFMVNIQYTVAAISDPLQNGRDLLNLGQFYVTTGFLNTQASVRSIWLTQASAVVIGHVVSLLLAHRIALKLWQHRRTATISQLPLAVFMVLYTVLGLWLLAAPRGA